MLAASNPEISINGSPPMHVFLLISKDGLCFEPLIHEPLIKAEYLSDINLLYRGDFIIEGNVLKALISYSTSPDKYCLLTNKIKGILQKPFLYVNRFLLKRYSCMMWNISYVSIKLPKDMQGISSNII